MPKRCRADGHGDYSPGCHLCELALTSEKYARHWGEPWPPPGVPGFDPKTLEGKKAGGKPAPPRSSLPCVFLGADTGERAVCRTCRRDPPVTAAVFACGKHGTCTRERAAVGVLTCCRWCGDYRSATEPSLPTASSRDEP